MNKKIYFIATFMFLQVHFVKCQNNDDMRGNGIVSDSNLYKIEGHFLVGTVTVPISDGVESSFTLHVQRHVKDDQNWTEEELVLPDGRTPPEVYRDVKVRWQMFYQDMVNKGMPMSEVQQILLGITGSSESAGVWILTGLNAAGYNGHSKSISLGPNSEWFTIAHESMHGWQWGATESPVNHKDAILLQDIFTKWANYVYHTRTSDPDKLYGYSEGKFWILDYLNYGLQNDAEWLANTFAGWLYGPDKVVGQNWLAMNKSAPEFVNFFNGLWKDGLSVAVSHKRAFGINEIKHPEYLPPDGVPSVEGFSKEDAVAIWSVCTNSPDKENYIPHFNSIIKRVAPDLPGSPADHYSLGYGDANHDGTIDWIASYTGPGPVGLGNGKYLWNKDNKVGTYTFIVSGKRGDTYAEYIQDPFLTLPSMGNGALAQPMFREWQGKYGSCNGASLFKYRTQEWIDEYLQDIEFRL
tara:strand:+ start:94 stop:1491 length:1398 start_codon:yes stop_codon:yes gene_type:complete